MQEHSIKLRLQGEVVTMTRLEQHTALFKIDVLKADLFETDECDRVSWPHVARWHG